MSSPVFLIGAEHSGTTLLALMLGGHSQIAWSGVFDFALDWPADHGPGLDTRMNYWAALAESREARRHRLFIRAELELPDLTRSFLDQLEARIRKPILGATAHRHFARVLALWPEARFVYLLRDGRDVARSHVERGRAGNVWAAASVWREAEREWRELCAAVPSVRRIEVRYENLVRDAKRELTRICDFLDVAYAPEMVDHPARSAHETPDPAESWREQLSARELAWLEREIGGGLRARGYAPSRVRAAWLPAPRRLVLRVGDRFGRVRFRMRRQRARVAQRFGLVELARVAALRLQTIDVAHPK
jgi:hypothetical protein